MVRRYSFSQKRSSMLSLLSCLMVLGLTMADAQTPVPTTSEQVPPMDWVYLPCHSTSPKTTNRGGINDPKLDAVLDARRLDPGPGRPAMQIWDYLREQVYRLSSIVPPHYRVSQSYLHAGGNPYCRFPGYCSYEAKTAWMSEQTSARKFDKFAQ